MAECETWKWQEPGTAWRKAGLYHITMVVASRKALLGTLIIPEEKRQASVEEERTKGSIKVTETAKEEANVAKEEAVRVEATPLGRTLVNMLWDLPKYQPDIQVLHYALMPDHLHMIWYVKKETETSIRAAVWGFWKGAQKLGRAYSNNDSSFDPTNSRHNYQESLLAELGEAKYYQLDPIFTEQPFIRPMARKKQLPAAVRYLDMNAERLAIRQLKPGYFRVQRDIEIAGQKYSGVGNIGILQAEKFSPVHVRRIWVEDAEQHGDATRLREYMNGCVLAARKGTVMVSPFISPKEKEVLEVLLREKHTIIYIAENGFGEYYKPTEGLFEAVAEGRMLILSPWQHDPDKPHVTRAECVAMNKMAEEICEALNKPE